MTNKWNRVFVLLAFLLQMSWCFSVSADDHRYRKADRSDSDRNSHDEKEDNDRHESRGYDDDDFVGSITSTVYKETCGACHFPYQPQLLPSGSWEKILSVLDDHFGETVDIDPDTTKAIGDYLLANGAERSSAKRARKIVRSLDGNTPPRITEIPYIREKHHEISPDVFSRPSIGSFSNCVACHTTAEKGVYDDDHVTIPRWSGLWTSVKEWREMEQARFYRLGQYEIIEDKKGTLWWRSHAGMADTKGGKCLIEGNILVLGPPEIQQPGSLRREFMEHLKKLSRWDKTEYYCSSHSLYDSRTGTKIRFGAGMAQYRPESHEPSVSDATEDMRRSETINRRQGYFKEISIRMDLILEKAQILLRRWSGRNKK